MEKSVSKKRATGWLIAAVAAFLVFILFTVLVATVDVQQIGPMDTSVGFAKANGALFSATGFRKVLFDATDWLGVVAILVAAAFAAVGLAEWIKRKKLKKVDAEILAMGGFYIAVIFFYVFFELVTVNYRPVILGTQPAPSYPSSTTLATYTILVSEMIAVNRLVSDKRIKYPVEIISALTTAFTVIGRMLCGAHWLTDILGGLILGTALLLSYVAALKIIDYKRAQKPAEEATTEVLEN